MTGIEAFTNLIYLECSYNNFTTLNLSSNTKLAYLRSINASLADLDISNATELTYLLMLRIVKPLLLNWVLITVVLRLLLFSLP